MRSTTIIAITLFGVAFAAPILKRDDQSTDILEFMKTADPTDPNDLQELQTKLAALPDEQKNQLATMLASAADAHKIFEALDDKAQASFEQWFVNHLSGAQEAFFVQQLTGKTDVAVPPNNGKSVKLPADLAKTYFTLSEDQRQKLIEFALTLGPTEAQQKKIQKITSQAPSAETPAPAPVTQQSEPSADQTETSQQQQVETPQPSSKPVPQTKPALLQNKPAPQQLEPAPQSSEPTADKGSPSNIEAKTTTSTDPAAAADDMPSQEEVQAQITQYINCIDAPTANGLIDEMKANHIDQATIDQITKQIPSLVAKAAGKAWTAPADCPAIEPVPATAPAAKRSLADLD